MEKTGLEKMMLSVVKHLFHELGSFNAIYFIEWQVPMEYLTEIREQEDNWVDAYLLRPDIQQDLDYQSSQHRTTVGIKSDFGMRVGTAGQGVWVQYFGVKHHLVPHKDPKFCSVYAKDNSSEKVIQYTSVKNNTI